MRTCCKFCGKSIDEVGLLSSHTPRCKSNPNYERNLKIFKTSYRAHPHTEETKKLLSEKRKLYLKNNPDKHPWKKSTKFKSIPCENLKNILKNKNINFVEEYTPFDDYNFSVDIAFPDIKVGIEINGNQHYNRDGSLTTYYQNRHNIFENRGWKIFEIHYSKCFDENNFNDILKLDIYDKDYVGVYFSKIELQNIKKEKQKIEKEERKNNFIEYRKKLLIDSEIDLTEYGWVEKVAKLFGIGSQHVRDWLKKYLPEFLENAYSRKK